MNDIIICLEKNIECLYKSYLRNISRRSLLVYMVKSI